MSLTAFQRYRRMQQVEEMKPENIQKEEKVTVEKPTVEEPTVEEQDKETKTSARRGRRTTK